MFAIGFVLVCVFGFLMRADMGNDTVNGILVLGGLLSMLASAAIKLWDVMP
jgi:hypothetical protein